MKTRRHCWRETEQALSARFTRWIDPPARLELLDDVVDVWRLEVEQPPEVVDHFERFLSADEIERADRFRLRNDRDTFVLTRGVLRTLLATYLSETTLDPSTVPLTSGRWGKPELGFCRETQRNPIEFNVSHSGGLAVLAFSHRYPVGVDVEKLRVDYEAQSRARRFFTESEYRSLEGVPDGQRTEAFFDCWTRKEAFMKATGKGFHMGMDSFSVSVDALQPRVLYVDGGNPEEWKVFTLEVGAHYASSLAVHASSHLYLRTMSATVSNSSSVQLDL